MIRNHGTDTVIPYHAQSHKNRDGDCRIRGKSFRCRRQPHLWPRNSLVLAKRYKMIRPLSRWRAIYLQSCQRRMIPWEMTLRPRVVGVMRGGWIESSLQELSLFLSNSVRRLLMMICRMFRVFCNYQRDRSQRHVQRAQAMWRRGPQVQVDGLAKGVGSLSVDNVGDTQYSRIFIYFRPFKRIFGLIIEYSTLW